MTGKWEREAQENRYPGISKWIAVWNRIHEKYGTCHIHFSGGEPFVYPDFFALIAELSKKHTLEFSTNLSFDAAVLIKIMDCRKAKVCASFHPEFSDFDTFLEKVLQLKQNNFSISITYVAYPLLLGHMEGIKKKCDVNSVSFIVQPFRGILQGRVYPESYTQQEKDIMKVYGSNTYDNKILFNYHMKEKKKKHNVLCRMGQMYAKIYACADVYRCEAIEGTKIGNLLDDKDFSLLDEAASCEKFPCSYCDGWRAMIVGEEEKWIDKWI